MGLEKWSDWDKGKTHSAAGHWLSAAGKAAFQFTMLTLWQKKALRPQAAPRGMPPQEAAFHTLYIYIGNLSLELYSIYIWELDLFPRKICVLLYIYIG